MSLNLCFSLAEKIFRLGLNRFDAPLWVSGMRLTSYLVKPVLTRRLTVQYLVSMVKTHLNRIRQLRQARGLTLDKLAAELHTTKQNISWMELGKGEIKLSQAVRLAEVLGVTVDELIVRDDTS